MDSPLTVSITGVCDAHRNACAAAVPRGPRSERGSNASFSESGSRV